MATASSALDMLGLKVDDVPGLAFPVGVGIAIVETEQGWFSPLFPKGSPAVASQTLAVILGLLLGMVFYHVNPWDWIFDNLYSWKGRWIGYQRAPLLAMPDPQRLVDARTDAIMAGVWPYADGLYAASGKLLDETSPEARKAIRLMTASKAFRAVVLPTIIVAFVQMWPALNTTAGRVATWQQAVDSHFVFWLGTLLFGVAFLVPYASLRIESMIERYEGAARAAKLAARRMAQRASPTETPSNRNAPVEPERIAADAAHNLAGRLRALGRAREAILGSIGKLGEPKWVPYRWWIPMLLPRPRQRRKDSYEKEMRSERQAELVPAIVRLEEVGREVAAAVAGGRTPIEHVLKRIEEQPGRQSNKDELGHALDCCFSAWPDDRQWSDFVGRLGNSFEADRLRQVHSALGSDAVIVQEWQNRLRVLDACSASVSVDDHIGKSGATNGHGATKETIKNPSSSL